MFKLSKWCWLKTRSRQQGPQAATLQIPNTPSETPPTATEASRNQAAPLTHSPKVFLRWKMGVW